MSTRITCLVFQNMYTYNCILYMCKCIHIFKVIIRSRIVDVHNIRTSRVYTVPTQQKIFSQILFCYHVDI